MGWLDSKEEKEQKERIKKMKGLIQENGLSNMFNDKDFQKVIIEQNHTIINLLIVQAIAQSGLGGDVVTLVHQDSYYQALEKLLSNK